MEYTIIDRDGKEIARGDEMEMVGEETNLWRESDGEGEFVEYNSAIEAGDERDFIWRRNDGTETTIGSLVCE